MMTEIRPSDRPPQLDDFCRICLLRKAQLRPLSSQIEAVPILEILYKVNGKMLEMNDQLPRVICERCLVKLELAYTISEEFRKQEELLRRLWWKGALVDQLMAYGQESRREPHSEQIIERLVGERQNLVPLDQASVGSSLADLDEDFGIIQEDTIQPVEQRGSLVKPESLDATAFGIEILPDEDDFEEESYTIQEEESKAQLHEVLYNVDNGLQMVLELEDLQKTKALPAELLKQLHENEISADETGFNVSLISSECEGDQDDEFLLVSLESEPEQNEHDNDDEDRNDETVNVHSDPAPVSEGIFQGYTKRQNAQTEGEFQCVTCSQHCASQEELKTHELSHKDELGNGTGKFQCQYCQKRFPWISRLNKHVERHERLRAAGIPERNLNGLHKCLTCGRRFADLGRFNAHMRRHEDVANRRFECKICNHPFSGKTELMRHERKHETDPEWRYAREKMKPPVVVKQDGKTVYKCEECQNHYASRFRYFQHIQRHIAFTAGLHQCHDCGKRYKIKKHLRHHQRTVHKLFLKADPEHENKERTETDVVNPTEPGAAVEIGKRLPFCAECDTYFLNQLNYAVHMRVHGGLATEGTTSANQEPTVSEEPEVTVESSQLAGRWYCKECGATSSSNRSRSGHQRRHTNLQILKFKCEVCKIAFSAHYELTRHRSGTHGLAPRMNTWLDPATMEACPLCSKPIKKDKLSQHIKAHENVQLEKFVCKTCGSAFGSLHHLKGHEATKTCQQSGYVPKPAKPLPASNLNAYFIWEDQRKPIPRSTSATDKPVKMPTRAEAATMLEQLADGSCRCKKCDKTFKGFTSAAAHARRHKIMEAGIYTCEICQQTFGAKLEREIHMKNSLH